MDCDDIAIATCLAAGDYWVEVSSDVDDAGSIDIEAITTPSSIGEDICTGALPLDIGSTGVLSCGDIGNIDGDSNACPDTEAQSCMAGVPGVWYMFTTDPALSTFDIDGGGYELFEGSCGSLNQIADCGLNTITADPNTTYFVLLDQGTVDFTTPAPGNEDCNNPDPLNENGTAMGTNVCATAPTGCNGDHSVWYEVDVTTNASTLVVTIIGGTISNAEVAIFDGCGGTQVDMMNCNDTATADCLAAGLYYVEVSSTTADAGTIDIEAVTTQPGPVEDICDNAIDLTIGLNSGILGCGDGGNEPGDPNACPDDNEAQGCMAGVPGIWYTFTTDAALASFDIDGDYELFEGSCTSLTFLADCGPNTITACLLYTSPSPRDRG